MEGTWPKIGIFNGAENFIPNSEESQNMKKYTKISMLAVLFTT